MRNILALVILFFISFVVFAKSTALNYEDISSVRLMNHNNVPIKVLVYREKKLFASSIYNNLDFVSQLSRVIADINAQGTLEYREKLKLVILDSTSKSLAGLPLSTEEKEEYITHLRFKGDRWLQDFGEIMVASTIDDPQEKLLIFDVNRGRGLVDLPPMLANFWNGYYFKLDNESTPGNYGGNIEATPNNIHYIGNTSTKKLQNFFKDHGQKDNLIFLRTDWLRVGHVDEYISTIITDDECGFALVKASPLRALELLKNASEDSFLSFPSRYEEEGYAKSFREIQKRLNTEDIFSKDYTPIDVIGRQLAKQKTIIAIIDKNINALIQKIKQKSPQCASIKVVEYPTIFKCSSSSVATNPKGCQAWIPGAANMLVLRDHLIIPDPFFTPYKNSINQQVTKLKQKVHYIDDMYYHRLVGEIHCGTNVFRLPNEVLNPAIY